MSALTRFSLKNRALIALITLFVFLGGIFASGVLRRELIPSLELPVVAVLTPVPGSSSNVIEEQVSRPLEAAILAVPNIKKVQSTSGDNTSSILVTLEYGTNLPDTQARIQRAVLGVPNLPEGSSPTVITGSIADFPIMQLSASGALQGDALAQRLRDHVIPTLEDIPGVRSVTISGIGVRNVSISLNKNKMKDAGLTTASVTAALQASGVTIPGGNITQGATELNVQVGRKITSLDQLRELPVSDATGAGALTGAMPIPGRGGGGAAAPIPAAPTTTNTPTPEPTTPAPTSTAPQPTPTNPPTGLPTALPTGLPTTLPPGYPTALPTLPGGLPSIPGGLPSIPGKFPPIPGGIPRLPGGFPTMPGGFPTKPTPTAPTVTQLGDIATIAFTPSDNISIARTNGKPSIALSVVKKPDASTVDISHAITDKLPQLSTRIPNGSMNVVFDQAPYIEQSIDDLLHEGLLGLAMAVLVVFTFLLSIRLTLVTAVSIPASLMVAMIGLKASNNTLNILTLGALTIAIGRVVDDSIVVVENIARKLDLGLPRIEAITTAVREVAGAVTASTIVTVAVFLPIGVVGGQAGELFRPFAITVGIAMLASLLVSLTIVPVLAYWFVRPTTALRRRWLTRHRTTPATPTNPHSHENGWMERLYIPTLHLALRRPIITMLIALLALATAAIGATGLKTQFIGSGAQNSIQITQTMPAGSTNEAVNTAAATVEKTLTNTPGVKTTMLTIGGSGLRMLGGSARTAQHALTLEEGTDSQTLTTALRAKLDTLTDIGEIRIGATGGPTNSQNVEIHIQGPDDDTLHAASEGLLTAVRRLEGVAQAHSDLGERVPSLHIDVNRSKALAKSVNETQIGKAIADAVKGRTIGKIEIGAAEHDLIIREGTAPTDQAAIANLVIGKDHKGKDVHVEDVADLKRETIPAAIHRIDGNRAVVITVTPADNDLGALTNRIRTTLNTTTLPAGATATIGGAASDQAEAFNQLGLATLAAIAITYVVMVATFGSLAQPFMLLISIPFAGIGAVLALLLTGTPLGVPAFIGILMLVGIVVTNAIVLIDRVNQHRNDAMPVREAVIAGARNRLRPIIMTALATILALTPMAASVTGGGAFISQPLALVVIGGLLSSTLLTLVIVPVLYVLLDALLTRLHRQRPREKNQPTPPTTQTPETNPPSHAR